MPHSTIPDNQSTMSQPPPSSPPIASSMAQVAPDTMETDSDIAMDETEQVDLLKLFDKDNIESDDEFPQPPSSAIAKHMSNLAIPSSSPPPPIPQDIAISSKPDDPDILLAFYRRLFPFRPMWQWLNHGIKPGPDTANRELAFTLRSEAYVRYQSYATSELWRKDVIRQNPLRFEIGPVYNSNPRDRKSLRKASAFKPVSKELCFDLDLTDYDDIRTCCSEANICMKCWQWATMAVKVVDTCLREDFGFEHILWVYSGRRGVHAWVCDKKVRELSDEKRRAIAGYLNVLTGDKKIKRPLHPHVERSIDILTSHFRDDILQDQNPWKTPEQTEALLKLLPDKQLTDALKKKWNSAPGRSSAMKWADINSLAESGVSKTLDPKLLKESRQDILLHYTYPRLDIEVSKKLNHLLKSPFVIHPKTGRVCVPIPMPPRKSGSTIDWSVLENFNPLKVPDVIGILNEIDSWDTKDLATQAEIKFEDTSSQAPIADGSGEKIQDYEKTALKPYVEYFKGFVAELLKSENRSLKREREDDGSMMVKEETKADAMEF